MKRPKMRTTRKDKPDLAAWLRRVRQDEDLQQQEFAKAIGVSRSLIAMMERGERNVNLGIIRKVQEEFINAPEPPILGELRGFVPAIGADRLGLIKYAGVVPCSTEWGDPLSGDDFRPIDYKFAAKNRFLCRVEGDSCAPALQPGDRVHQLLLLNQAVANSIVLHSQPGTDLATKNGRFDWTLGPGVSVVRDATHADYALFTYIRDSRGGDHTALASLVDLRTGQVVWFNLLRDDNGGLRDPASTRATVASLLEQIPL